MKKILPLISIFSVLFFAFLYWQRSQQPEMLKGSPVSELSKSIEKINKIIPKKIAPQKIKESELIKKDPTENLIQFRPKSSGFETLPEEDISNHRQTPDGSLVITSVTLVDNLIIAHGDLIVGKVEDMEEFLERAKSGEPLIMPAPKLWQNGIIPYVVDDELSNRNQVLKAIETINKKSNIKWIEQKDESNYVRFTKGPLNCYSPLGMIGGEQTISLEENCSKGSIMHEMLHTMGLLHEQNREDRDKYIRILWENIDSKNHLQFQKISNKLLDLKKLPFDFNSIMLYRQSAFSKYPGDYTIVKIDGDTYDSNIDELSSEDLKKLSSLYPKQ